MVRSLQDVIPEVCCQRLTAFLLCAGRAFEFMGEVGRFYNLISEQSHQLTMKLTLGQMWDHNGTYMSGLGFMYQKHKILAELGEDDNLAGEHHSL